MTLDNFDPRAVAFVALSVLAVPGVTLLGLFAVEGVHRVRKWRRDR